MEVVSLTEILYFITIQKEKEKEKKKRGKKKRKRKRKKSQKGNRVHHDT